jgi:transposase
MVRGSPLDTATINAYCNNSYEEKTLAKYLEQVTRETDFIEARNKLNDLVPEMKKAPTPEVFLGPEAAPAPPKS